MSRASAAVLFPDGTIKYAMYCGTTDRLWPRLFSTIGEAWDAYERTKSYDAAWAMAFQRPAPAPAPDGTAEPVWIYESYGYGAEWVGKATREFVVSELDTFEIEELTEYGIDTDPEWVRWE